MSGFETLRFKQVTVDGITVSVRLSWPSAMLQPRPLPAEELSPSQNISCEADRATRDRIQREGHRVLAEAYEVVQEGLAAGACVLLEDDLKVMRDQVRAAE